MITRQANRLQIEGALTIANARSALEEGLAQIEGGAVEIDLANLGAVDSSAISIMLEWIRAARRKNADIRFFNLSDDIKSLAKLYGVTELIPLG